MLRYLKSVGVIASQVLVNSCKFIVDNAPYSPLKVLGQGLFNFSAPFFSSINSFSFTNSKLVNDIIKAFIPPLVGYAANYLYCKYVSSKLRTQRELYIIDPDEIKIRNQRIDKENQIIKKEKEEAISIRNMLGGVAILCTATAAGVSYFTARHFSNTR